MAYKRASTNLSLECFEEAAYHFILSKLSPNQIESLVQSGTIALGHSLPDVQLWSKMLTGDLMICFSIGERSKFFACRVLGRGIMPSSPVDPLRVKEDQPFLLFLHIVGEATNFRIRNEAFYFIDSHETPPRHIFKDLWEQCRPFDAHQEPPHRIWTSLDLGGYEIKIASSHEDFLYISRMAAYHPFGPRRAFLSLIAFYQDSPVGAILVERGKDLHTAHRAAWRVFRRDYSWIQARSVDIVRIYSDPNTFSRFRLHRALLGAAIEMAPALVEQPLSIIEGVSYNYHPLAPEFGFNVELPQKLEDSFYYWKAFNAPIPMSSLEPQHAAIKSKIKDVIRSRRSVKYWFAYGRLEDIEVGAKKRMWGIRKQHPNTGRWSALQPGNIIFLLSHDQKIRAYGRVDSKEIKKIKNYEQFPLVVSFSRSMVAGLSIDASAYTEEPWFRQIEAGGIIPLPDEFGASVKASVDEQRKDGKMWVEPNPYILHKTDFDIIHGQVFVVQAWDLRETVYPMIKTILEAEGYRVTYSGDRDGQLVFEDIWLMLNESEAILVDFTFRRPNVYLEYGMALVLGKPIIAITQSKDDIPSDTPNLKYIIYQDKLGDQSLRRQLPRAIRDIISDIQMMRTRRRSASSRP